MNISGFLTELYVPEVLSERKVWASVKVPWYFLPGWFLPLCAPRRKSGGMIKSVFSSLERMKPLRVRVWSWLNHKCLCCGIYLWSETTFPLHRMIISSYLLSWPQQSTTLSWGKKPVGDIYSGSHMLVYSIGLRGFGHYGLHQLLSNYDQERQSFLPASIPGTSMLPLGKYKD